MNVSTKTYLLDLLGKEERKIRDEHHGGMVFEMMLAKVNDARRLVEQCPEEPTR